MAVAAETMFSEQNIQKEVYARSLRGIRLMGELAVKNALKTPEYEQAHSEVWGDFYTAVGENLATDPVYGEQLYFDPMEERPIVNGQVVDKNGTPIYMLVQAGGRKSRHEARHHKDEAVRNEMAIQAVRDEGDDIIVHIVDKLEIGESYTVFSPAPEAELARNPDFWQDTMHYRSGMGVIQHYYRASKDVMLTGNYSVKNTNIAMMRQIFLEQGRHVPENESLNHWSRYGIRQDMSEQQARELGLQLLNRHKVAIGDHSQSYSVTQYIHERQEKVKQYFETYMVPLTTATASGNNNKTMSSLAHSLLKQAKNYKTDELPTLMRVANSSTFNEDDARFMEDKIRFALVEELRKDLPALLTASNISDQNQITDYNSTPVIMPVIIQHNPFMLQILNEQASRNVASGMNAGRTYGGCIGAGSKKSEPNEAGAKSQQAYGGVDAGQAINAAENTSEDGECEYSGTFCYCCPYNVDGTPLSSPVEITAKRDKNGTAACQRTGCGATLDKNGNGSKGKIYARAMAIKSRKESK